MALTTPTALTVVASGAAATLVSAAYTPTANGIQVAFISATGSINGQTLTAVSSTHTGQGAWTIVQYTPIASSNCCAAIAYSVTGSSPGSGTLTATFTSAGTDNELFVAETTGQDTSTPVNGSNFAGAATTSTTPVLTLSAAPTTDDITFVTFAGRNIGAAPSVPSATGTFTSLASNNHVNPCASIMGSYRLSSTSTGITPAGMGTIANAGAAIVVKAAVTVASVPPIQSANPGLTWRRRFKHRQTLPPPPPVANTYSGDTTTALTFSATADTTRTTLGQTTTALTFGATADATRTTLGQSTTALTFSATADTTRTTLGQTSTAFTFGATADTTRTTLGQTTSSFIFGATADTVRTTLAQTTSTFTLGLTADATVAHSGIQADVAQPFTFGATADTTRTTLGQTTTALTFGATADTVRTTLGQSTTALTFSATAAAARTTLGQAATPLTLTFSAAAARTTLGQDTAAFTLAFTASATVSAGGVPGFAAIGTGTAPRAGVSAGNGPYAGPGAGSGARANAGAGIGSSAQSGLATGAYATPANGTPTLGS